MKKKSIGWVIINENHPNNSNVKNIYSETFAYRRKDCIAKFVEFCGSDWRYWYRKYNFRCVKATILVSIMA